MEIKDIEAKLWKAADQLRGNLSAEEYMHVILGILSLKYISDRYDVAIKKLKKEGMSIDLITPDMFYAKFDAFIVPDESRWTNIMKFASTDEVGLKMDEAFISLEKRNPMLNGIFNKNYNGEGMDQNRLGEVIKIFSDEDFTEAKEDIIGRIYEYFLGNFFKDRGQKGGEFYTPKSIVKLIVNLIKPIKGSIYDPAVGTGGMLIQAKRYIQDHGGKINDITVYGQEFNNVTWKLAKLNLILNGFPLIDNDDHGVLGDKSADTFTNDQHKLQKFDFIMANPPFNLKNWGREKLLDDPRWSGYGLPPKGNANYAWLLHMLSKLSIKGKMGVVLANGSLSTSSKEELAIRKEFLNKNKVDAIISLPDKLFYTVGIPASIWIFNNHKKTKDILMIDASELEGKLVSKKLRELTGQNIDSITDLYNLHLDGKFIKKIGFAKTVKNNEIVESNYSFVPGRYVGYEEEKIDKEAIKEEIKKASNELNKLFDEFKDSIPKVKESIKKALNHK